MLGRTRVGFRYHLIARPRWWSCLLRPIMGRVFARDPRERLAARETAVEDYTPRT